MGDREAVAVLRRDEIVPVAAKLFHERGYGGTSMDEIGLAAGMTGPALYHHFRSKQAIIDAITVEGIQALLASADRAVAGARTPEESLRALVRTRVEFAFGAHRYVFPIFFNDEASVSEEARRRIGSYEELYVAHWMRSLVQLRPEVSTVELHTAVKAAHVVISFMAIRNQLVAAEDLKLHLARMAFAVLMA